MEDEVSKSNCERPTKKFKCYSNSEHEELSPECSELKKDAQDHVDSLYEDDMVNGLAPARKGRVSSTSESSNDNENSINENSALCLQEEEVSSSVSITNDNTVLTNHSTGNTDSVTNQEQDNALFGNKDIKEKD